jgi:hypothetical protein
MRPILIALAALVLLGAKPAWAGPTTPYLTLDTPPPYHYGGTIQVTTHGDIRHESRLQMFCDQGGALVYIESIDASITETTYTLHFGTDGGSNQWVSGGGGAADCQIRFSRNATNGQPGFTPYTVIDIHVEA